MRTRGFLIGATAGRTTLAGEGLQHQDGNSHLLAFPYPTLRAYDPAYAYELAVIVQDGMKRMIAQGQDLLYYITVTNENYRQPAMPDGVADGIIKGMYLFRKSQQESEKPAVQLMGSGAILNRVLAAADLLEQEFNLTANVWSVTSYKELHRDALDTERWNMLNAGEEWKKSYLETVLEGMEGIFVAATDYVKALPETIAKWLPGPLVSLGTDGFGRSDGRRHLREFFEVDERFIALAALYGLARQGHIDSDQVKKAAHGFGIDPNKPNPVVS
jgi:pyruvate dehydrogenase E1 component